MALAGLLIAVLAIIVSGVSAAYAKKQAEASKAQAHEAAKVTAIEQKRWHADLTPQLQIECLAKDEDGQQAMLTIDLIGPAGLDGLSQVSVRVRDDRQYDPGVGGTLTQEQIDNTIWGPYRFSRGQMDTDQLGRVHGPFPLPKNEPHLIALEQSVAPSWNDNEYWRRRYKATPVRLEIICQRDGHEPWVIPTEITVRYPPSSYDVSGGD